MEARGQNFIDAIHFTPNIDKNEVTAKVLLEKPAIKTLDFELVINESPKIILKNKISKGNIEQSFTIAIPNAKLI